MNKKCTMEVKYRTIFSASSHRRPQVNSCLIPAASPMEQQTTSPTIHHHLHYVRAAETTSKVKPNGSSFFSVAPPPKATTPRRNNMNGNQDLFGADPFQPITKPFNVSIDQLVNLGFLTQTLRKSRILMGWTFLVNRETLSKNFRPFRSR